MNADITKFSSVLVVIGVIFAVLLFMTYIIGIRSISQLYDAFYAFIERANMNVLLVMGGTIFAGILMFGWMILRVVFNYLNFDQYGISVLNDISFSSAMRWSDVRSVEVVQKQIRKTGYHHPFLEIEYVDSKGETQKENIRNALKDTSVYELYEIMEAHRLFNGF